MNPSIPVSNARVNGHSHPEKHIVDREFFHDLEQQASSLDPSQEELSELFYKVEKYARRHLASIHATPAFVRSKERSIGLLSSPIAETGIPLDETLQLLYDFVDHEGVNSGSPRYLGYIPSGGLIQSAFGDFLAAIGGRFAGVFDSGPGAVRMENMLVRWMAEILGYPKEAGGYLASGGSIANLSAVITAREAHGLRGSNQDPESVTSSPNWWMEEARGLRGSDYERAVIYMTSHTHHCVDKALRIAGMGRSVKRRVAEDGQYRMSAEALEEAIAADRAAGLNPWLVVASAGTTNTGSVDPLEDIASVAHSNNLWLHVDGAYGGFFVLCPEGRKALSGIHQADSIVLDPHKTLFLPFGTGALLVRDQEFLGPAHGGRGAYMLDMESDAHEFSPAYVSPELSKHFRGLRMWLPLKLVGVAPFRAALSEKIHLARYAYERLQSFNGFQVGPYPDLSIVTYRFIPKRGDVNAFNLALVNHLQQDGRIYVTSTRIGDKVVLRLAIISFRTHLDDLDESLEILNEHASALMNE